MRNDPNDRIPQHSPAGHDSMRLSKTRKYRPSVSEKLDFYAFCLAFLPFVIVLAYCFGGWFLGGSLITRLSPRVISAVITWLIAGLSWFGLLSGVYLFIQAVRTRSGKLWLQASWVLLTSLFFVLLNLFTSGGD